jgi:opacity protein-like surface antigen
MFRKAMTVAAVLLVVTAASAMAQSKVQASVFGGYTLSDGVTGTATKAPDGNTYSAVDLKDGGAWGFTFGVNANDNIEIGFLLTQQFSALALQGTVTRDLGSLTVTTYHPYVAFNLKDADAKVRPYVLIGLGATHYPSVGYTQVSGQTGMTASQTKFSTALGAGVKAYASPKVGLQVGILWVPTYIKSDATGWWCDPWYGCYVTSNAQYSNQFMLNAGMTFRF